MFSRPRRLASLSAASTISGTASVQVTEPVEPTMPAIVSDGSPAPPATSSTDCPSCIPACSTSARVSGANIMLIVAACFVQYFADSRHPFTTGFSLVIFVNPEECPVWFSCRLCITLDRVGRNEELKPVKYLIADAAKHSESGKLVAFYCCGIVKAPVDAVSGSWKHRAVFVRIVTHRDHVIELAINQIINSFRALL